MGQEKTTAGQSVRMDHHTVQAYADRQIQAEAQGKETQIGNQA